MIMKDRAKLYEMKKEVCADIDMLKHYTPDNDYEVEYNAGLIEGMTIVLSKLNAVMGGIMKYNNEWITLWKGN